MNIQVLVTTMNKDVSNLIQQMNLEKSNVIIANQNGKNRRHSISNNKTEICSNSKGASINRNIAISNAEKEIVIFSDDDQTFISGFEHIVMKEFDRNPNIDAIKFYCESTNPQRPLSFKRPSRFKKANFLNLMSAGIHGFAIKLVKLKDFNLKFPEEIGPGKTIYMGEDSIFLKEAFVRGIKIYLSPLTISIVRQDKSSWFKGYTEQYFKSIGYVYKILYGKFSIIAAMKRAFKLRNINSNMYSIPKMIKIMYEGMHIKI